MTTPYNDRKLFDKIAKKYAYKDIYEVSKSVRRFQIDTLMGLLEQSKLNEKFSEILEIGCGNGANSTYLDKYYSTYIGTDFSDELIKIAEKTYSSDTVKFFPCDIIDLNSEKKYDLIVCVGVLHHLTDLKKYLKKITELGTKNANFVILEPQAQNPVIQFFRFLRKKIDRSYSITQIYFKKSELESAIYESGLKIIKSKFTGYFTPPFAQVVLKPKCIFLPLVKLLIKVDEFIQTHLPNRFSWNISIVAGKKDE